MLMRFDPFADFDRLARQMLGERSTQASNWYMPVDAYRSGDRFHLEIDLPGVDPESVDLEVENNSLTVRAERGWNPDENVTVLVHERPHGEFTRQFFLGEGLDTDHIEAGYDNGVLKITIPVAEEAKPRKIIVGSSEKALTG